MINIILKEEDFKNLVRGEIVKQDGVQIILQDMGFDRMHHQINLATVGHAVRKKLVNAAARDKDYLKKMKSKTTKK